MSPRFDDLSRELARPTSRRGVLKLIGGAAAAATAATVLRPFRAQASCAVPCGSTCCAAGQTCSDAATGCCCASGTTPCGTSCCKSGVACVNASTGLCGCPSGYTQCGRGTSMTCCPSGKACGSAGCVPASDLTTKSTAKTCSAPLTCLNVQNGCESAGNCNGNGGCFCYQTAEGGSICQASTNCANNCTRSADCPSGQVCIVNTCCGGGICVSDVPCTSGTAASAAASGERTTPQRS